MKTEEIRLYLSELNDELRAAGVKGEICLYGGAVMCLVFDARPGTKDVDAVFKPTREIREAAERIAQAHGLRKNWLNDAVKGFVVPHSQRILLDFPNLKVYVPEPDYLLAMKALAARADTLDAGDVRLLIEGLAARAGRGLRDTGKVLPAPADQAGDAVFYSRVVRAMTSLREVKERIEGEPRWWLIHLMDFVDDFRHYKDPRAVAEPFRLSDEKTDAVLASTAESLCDELGIEPPEWLGRVPACREPYFVGGFESLKAISIVESPLRFRIRKIFVLDNFLSRV